MLLHETIQNLFVPRIARCPKISILNEIWDKYINVSYRMIYCFKNFDECFVIFSHLFYSILSLAIYWHTYFLSYRPLIRSFLFPLQIQSKHHSVKLFTKSDVELKMLLSSTLLSSIIFRFVRKTAVWPISLAWKISE